MFKSILLVILAVLPTIIIATYVYKKDKHKEPFYVLFVLFCLGVFSSLAVVGISAVLEYIIPNFSKDLTLMNITELLLKTFIEVALIEELCKWFVVYLIGYKNKEFDETYDVIIYAIFTALGFATLENIFYIHVNNTIQVAIERGIFSIPAHTSYAIFMSYYLCLAKISDLKNNKKEEKLNLLKSILVPTLFHGIFDFCLFTEKTSFLVLFIIFTIFLFLMAYQRLKDLYQKNASLLNIQKCCINCGTPYKGNTCPKCIGSRQD